MIHAENIFKSYNRGAAEVLKGISLDIADSEFVAITGASGSGKSTLMSVLSGLERPDKGSVSYGNERICDYTEKQLTAFRRKTVGFVFQQYFLLPHLNVDKNVRMGADLCGNKRYREIIEEVGLSAKLKSRPSELSGGEQQRVCIARALAKNPQVLFLDEPTGALDEATGRSVLDYIIKLHKECGFSMVMVTHNLNIAETADTVIKINSGKICERYANSSPKTAYEIGW